MPLLKANEKQRHGDARMERSKLCSPTGENKLWSFLPGSPTGPMDHVDKYPRPHVFKRTDVKVEPENKQRQGRVQTHRQIRLLSIRKL